VAELFDDLIESRSSSLSPLIGEGIVIDIGTGDGHFVYQSARANPNNRRRICAPDGILEIISGLDPERDASEIQRLGLQRFSIEVFDQELGPRYRASGFEILERGVLAQSDWPRLRTSWAKRLRNNEARTLVYIVARAAAALS
jgi:methylase of polypeptide subunit release factors